ncbi:hypothetical protein [Lachnoclostridium sp. An118]|uniref:hypothetical protein n=1 Tax=Lachnoclostridium sp. An118 TaxID=1965547 RepID=UPI000B3A2AFE|nr:hypothetical protein [Lachnoclostridium sp. An118]OUQ48532.1 hypothetical protein B5E62_13305 [Lachnoclostridium sp. An118]
MKLAFNFKKKEASLQADVEGMIERGLERKEKSPKRKTRYQIRQEEKRKNMELKRELERKQMVQGILMMAGVIVFFLIICTIGSSINW